MNKVILGYLNNRINKRLAIKYRDFALEINCVKGNNYIAWGIAPCYVNHQY